MKITESNVRKIKIEEIEKLDPISVYLEDFERGQGKITISCYDKTWSSYWGSMGRTILEFFCTTDNNYLAKNLANNINPGVVDEEKSIDYLKNRVIECRKGCCENGNTFDKFEAREAWEEVSGIENPKEWLMSSNNLVQKLIGEEWWHVDFPQKQNPDYVYLCRIICTVKEVLKTQFKKGE